MNLKKVTAGTGWAPLPFGHISYGEEGMPELLVQVIPFSFLLFKSTLAPSPPQEVEGTFLG